MSRALLSSESRELRSTTLSIQAKLLQGLSEPPANTRVFSQLLVQFYSKQPQRSGAKDHVQILLQAAKSCTCLLTPSSSAHL